VLDSFGPPQRADGGWDGHVFNLALLHGVTGSGKTEVYLHAAARALDAGRQALVLVPEINLTPQLEARFAARFPAGAGQPAQRADAGAALPLAAGAPGPGRPGAGHAAGGVRVDAAAGPDRRRRGARPQFKQQEGARYSARDLAVYRGHLDSVPVLLGSATPSLETWQRTLEGRYRRLTLPSASATASMPRCACSTPTSCRVATACGRLWRRRCWTAMQQRIERGEQSLLLLNRRGYAPVLHCGACAWKSGCPHCSAWRVFHKLDRTLRCHHCGFTERCRAPAPTAATSTSPRWAAAPRSWKSSSPALLPGARIARIDADSTRTRGRWKRSWRRARRRGRRAGRHADGGQGARLPPHHAGGGHQPRRRAVQQRLPRRRAAVRAADAGRRPRRARRRAGRAQRDVDPDLAPAAPAVPGAGEARLRGLRRQPARRARRAGLPPFSQPGAAARRGARGEVATAFLQAASAEPQPTCPARGGQCLPAGAAAGGARGRHRAHADAGRVGLAPGAAALPPAWLPALHTLRRPRHKGLVRWAIDVDPLPAAAAAAGGLQPGHRAGGAPGGAGQRRPRRQRRRGRRRRPPSRPGPTCRRSAARACSTPSWRC
jgi:primosomal protein N' (replication factor Y)